VRLTLAWLALGASVAAGACSSRQDTRDGLDAGAPADARADVDTGTSADVDSGHAPLCDGDAGCRVAEVVTGIGHACARLESGLVSCWGSNEFRQLARDGLDYSPRPLEVIGAPALVRFIAGDVYACGVTAGGAIWCWGTATNDLFDATGGPSSGWLSRAPDAVDFARGSVHACAIRSARDVVCWGFLGGDGQLGIGTRDATPTPTVVTGIADVVELAIGGYFTCARTSSGHVACWGDNETGEVGDGTGGTDASAFDRLSPVPILDGIRRLTAGGTFACALAESGQVSCWGDNVFGQVGIGSHALAVPAPTPVALPADETYVDVIAAEQGGHACALAASGHVYCWGSNGFGQLGGGSSGGQANEPVSVAVIDDATALALGDSFTCAVRRSGELWCWGLNDAGQLGDGTRTNRAVPVRVVGLR